jgi:hypothetical protein
MCVKILICVLVVNIFVKKKKKFLHYAFECTGMYPVCLIVDMGLHSNSLAFVRA